MEAANSKFRIYLNAIRWRLKNQCIFLNSQLRAARKAVNFATLNIYIPPKIIFLKKNKHNFYIYEASTILKSD